MVGTAAGAATVMTGLRPRPAFAAAPPDIYHSAWVWQFSDDGPPALLRSVLAANRLGVLVKTHDGVDWMSRYDHSPDAIDGPDRIRGLVSYFEKSGVPFHAWCVVTGLDPIAEARMGAEVLAAGARSLVIDLEPVSGHSFWQAGDTEAVAYGQELRRLQPNAWISVAPDPRPWQIDIVPMDQFAAFANEIAPQAYWTDFGTASNLRLMSKWGYDLGPAGLTPENVLDVTRSYLAQYNLPLHPIGPGDGFPDDWRRFVGHAYSLGMKSVSVWRYGTTDPANLQVLGEMAPAQPARPPATPPLVLAPPSLPTLQPSQPKPLRDATAGNALFGATGGKSPTTATSATSPIWRFPPLKPGG